MKIDEARNRVVDKFCNLRNAYVDHLAYDGKGDTETEALIHALDEVITALDWYIDQDLIKREDVIPIISICADNCKYDSCVDCGIMRLHEIPKAVYSREKDK